MATYTPDLKDIEVAKRSALDLDIRLTDTAYYMHRGSKMRKRLSKLVDMARDIRNELDRIEAETKETDQS